MDVTATTASQNDIQSHLGSSAISEGCDVTCASKRISAHSILASPGPRTCLDDVGANNVGL